MKKVFIKLGKTLAFTALSMYIVITLVNQQITLMDLKDSRDQYAKQIQEEKLRSEQLAKIKGEISTPEYIEDVAREKLGLVMPYEIVFVDANL
ncbi:MAG: septum formation initiator family protein [Clostridia bacterium]|nr:septum formation initiator family protein [Clostridia bacterium]